MEYSHKLGESVWNTWTEGSPPEPKTINHRPHAMGHLFGEELVCGNPGCGVDFNHHTKYPNVCTGMFGRAKNWTGDGGAPDPKLRRLIQENGILLKDIARIALVSTQTVSNALTRSKGMRRETRAQMLWFAKELLRRKGVEA